MQLSLLLFYADVSRPQNHRTPHTRSVVILHSLTKQNGEKKRAEVSFNLFEFVQNCTRVSFGHSLYSCAVLIESVLMSLSYDMWSCVGIATAKINNNNRFIHRRWHREKSILDYSVNWSGEKCHCVKWKTSESENDARIKLPNSCQTGRCKHPIVKRRIKMQFILFAVVWSPLPVT